MFDLSPASMFNNYTDVHLKITATLARSHPQIELRIEILTQILTTNLILFILSEILIKDDHQTRENPMILHHVHTEGNHSLIRTTAFIFGS